MNGSNHSSGAQKSVDIFLKEKCIKLETSWGSKIQNFMH